MVALFVQIQSQQFLKGSLDPDPALLGRPTIIAHLLTSRPYLRRCNYLRN